MAHIHEKIDFTTSVYVVFENKVAFHLHKKLNIWLPPGGHIELDEDPNIAAAREVKEEIGVDIELIGNPVAVGTDPSEKELLPPKYLNRHHFNETHEHIDFIYFGRAMSGELVPEESGGEVRWFSREEIEKNELNIKPRVCAYALVALDELAT